MNPSQQPIGVLVTGEPVPEAAQIRGSFVEMVRRAAGGAWPFGFLPIDARGQELPLPDTLAGVVVTGSPASVTESLAWMLRAEAWLRLLLARPVPVLGICFGHQLLAKALGGRVTSNPRGREIGTLSAEILVDDPLLGAQGSSFLVNMTHVDSVVEVPRGAIVIARTELEQHAAIRFGPLAWGVQFHPEFDGAVLAAYLQGRSQELSTEGIEVDRALATVGDTPRSRDVLRRFLALVQSLSRA